MGCGASAPATEESKPAKREEEWRDIGVVASKPAPAASAPLGTSPLKPKETPRKSRSMEVNTETAQSEIAQAAADDEDDDDANQAEWKVKRRVSRRLSLDVQRKPGTNGSPAWAMEPTAAEQMNWDDAADSDIMGISVPVQVTTYKPPTTAVE